VAGFVLGFEGESGLGSWAVWVCRINASCVRKDFGYVIPGGGGD